MHLTVKTTQFKFSPGLRASLVSKLSQYAKAVVLILSQGTYKNQPVNGWKNKSMFLPLSN